MENYSSEISIKSEKVCNKSKQRFVCTSVCNGQSETIQMKRMRDDL